MSAESVFSISMPELVFGEHAMAEVGERAAHLGIRHAALMSDANLASAELFGEVKKSLHLAGISVSEIADLAVEPTDQSFQKATADLSQSNADGVISFGGGSVMDTAKAANLYASAPADFLRYVNAPIGEAGEPESPLLPHIACPTTCGTGSECTGIAVF